jgi:hypothetical protein
VRLPDRLDSLPMPGSVVKPSKKARQRIAKKEGKAAAADGSSGSNDEMEVSPSQVPFPEEAAAPVVVSDEEPEPPPKKVKAEVEEVRPSTSTPSGVVAAPVVAVPPFAPATPVVEPSMGDLLAAISHLSLSVGKRFDSVEQRMDTSDLKVVGVCSDLKAFQDEVNAKFAALASAGPATATKKVTPPWSLPSAGGASSYYTAAAVPADQKAPPWASTPSAGTVEFGRKVFALGFPRKIPRTALMAVWDGVKAKMPAHLTVETKFQGGHGKTFGVVFPSREAARLFTATVRDATLSSECRWVSPREGEGSSLISFRLERTIAERDRGRALSKSWTLLSPLVRWSPAWKVGMKLITDTTRGTIAIATGDDMWELIELKPDGSDFTVIAFEANLQYFGVGAATIEAVRSSTAKISEAPSGAAASGN